MMRGRVICSVLTGYVLVRCLYSPDAMVGLCGVEHVIEVVGGSLSPWRIPDKTVVCFKGMADKGAYNYERPAGLFRKDGKVRVSGGPFDGLTGVIVTCRQDGKGDAVVEVDILGRMTPMLVPLAILLPM